MESDEAREVLNKLPEKIHQVIMEFPTVFRRKVPEYLTLRMSLAKIILKDGKEDQGYHCGGCRKTPLHKRKQACQLIKDLKAQGVIEPATPDLFVPKQDGEILYIVTDFSGVNQLTR